MLTFLMESTSMSSFSSDKTYRIKSLLTIRTGGTYSCTGNKSYQSIFYLQFSDIYLRMSALLLKRWAISDGSNLFLFPI
jgi:hypothetical protein